MLKQAITILLFVPAFAGAECGFVSNSNEMTIVVSKQSNNKCFKSEQFREALRDNLISAVNTMNERSPSTPAGRRPRPSGLPLPVQQAELYYGQVPKR